MPGLGRNLLYCLLVVIVAGCSNWSGDGNAVSDKIERMKVSVWVPRQSRSADALIREQVDAFNDNQRNIQVELSLIGQANYTSELEKAREKNLLPEVVCLDLTLFKEFVADDLLLPLDKMMSRRLWHDLLPDMLEQGHIGTHIYGVPAVHKSDEDMLWGVLGKPEDGAATMAFIHYLLHPQQQRMAVESGYTEPVTRSVLH